MSTRPDIAINIQIGDEKPEINVEVCFPLLYIPETSLIIFECKKKGHTKKPDELTGQEIAHMIGTTFAFNAGCEGTRQIYCRKATDS